MKSPKIFFFYKGLYWKFSILLLLLILKNNAFAQNLIFNNLNIQDGLSQTSVLCMAQDQQGFIWMGSGSGLNRYDSKTFRVYKNDQEKSASISGNYISSILNDSKNNLWVGTLSGLNKYNSEKDNFTNYLHDERKESISNNYIKCIYEDKKGKIWVGTTKGLNIIENSQKITFSKLYLKNQELDIMAEEIHAIKQDYKGNMWISSNDHLTRISLNFGKTISKTFKIPNKKGQPGNYCTITAIEEDENRELWFGTKESGLYKFEESNESFLSIASTLHPKNILIHDFVRKILADKNGKLWIGTQEGLVSMDLKTQELKNFQNDPENKKSISQNSIYELFFDKDKNLWIGTYYGGANIIYARNTPFNLIQSKGEKKNVVNNNVISSIIEFKKDILVIGTEGGGLNFIDRVKGKIQYQKVSNLNKNSIKSNLIKKIYKDKEGVIWVGTHDGGLGMFDKDMRPIKQFENIQNSKNQICSNNVIEIFEDNIGKIWIGTEGNGLNSFDKKKNIFMHFHPDSIGYKRLNALYIRSIVQDEIQTLWLGTEKGLFIKPQEELGFKKYDHIFNGNIRISDSVDISCIYMDSKNQIWIGTLSDGIYLIKPKEDQLINYRTKNGIPSNQIKRLIEDKEGNIWISTDKGLCKFDEIKKIFSNYTISDGLPGNEFNFNSSFLDTKGEMFLGGLEGLVYFTPTAIEKNSFKNNIVFTSLKIGNKVIEPNDEQNVLSKSIWQTKNITLQYSQNEFSVEFRLLNYIKPDKNVYSYNLEGFEKDWNTSSLGIATYTNLPSGNYRLIVRAANNDGSWDNKEAILIIKVLPPIWATWWAYLIYIVSILSIIIIIFRFFWMRTHLKHEKDLQQYKFDFFTNVSHEIRTHLTLIVGPLDSLEDESRSREFINKQLLQIKKHTKKLSILVSELLDFRKAETGNLKLNYTKENLVEFIEELNLNFQEPAYDKHIKLSFNYSTDQIFVYIDKLQFEKVITNLISNSLKFTHIGGCIKMNAEIRNNSAYIKIQDNGIGIAPKYFKKLFSNYFQINNYKLENTGYGIGLALSKSIIELHNGSIEVESTPQKENQSGQTIFTLKLPLYKNGQEEKITKSNDEIVAFENISENESENYGIRDGFPTLLVVEDNDELREFLKDALSINYTIYEANDGATGLITAENIIPDIIISDIMMPGIDGIELCKKIKANQKTNHIPIIILTAKATINDQILGLETHADAYIAKPFNLKLLETQISNLIENRKVLQEKFKEQYFQTKTSIVTESIEDSFMLSIIEIIETNLDNADFKVAAMARDMAMSQSVLYKKLKAITGMSVNEFIKSVRLKRAAELLKNKKYTIYEVAYMVGFTDRKYFSKEFKKIYGKNPTEFD